MNQALCISIVGKYVSFGNQILTQFQMVINLSIEYNHHIPCLVKHRLHAMIQIDNAEAAEPKSHFVIDIHTLLIRSAVCNLVHHLLQYCLTVLIRTGTSNKSTYSTHKLQSSFLYSICCQSPFHTIIKVSYSEIKDKNASFSTGFE